MEHIDPDILSRYRYDFNAKELTKQPDSIDSFGYGDVAGNYKMALRKEVISVLRGQAMLGLLNSHMGSAYASADYKKGSQVMTGEHIDTLMRSGQASGYTSR